jgi:uncharacterized metal-binding protein YceD (DUF177 family)
MTKPEFSRPMLIDAIGRAPSEILVEANEDERAALARRFGIPDLPALNCRFTLWRDSTKPTIIADGLLSARVVQTCVVSLDEFESELAESFTIAFVPAGSEAGSLDLEAPDEIPFQNARIDLGEAAAEQLALALHPFPRKPGAHFEGTEDAAAGSFAALQSLRRSQ